MLPLQIVVLQLSLCRGWSKEVAVLMLQMHILLFDVMFVGVELMGV